MDLALPGPKDLVKDSCSFFLGRLPICNPAFFSLDPRLAPNHSDFLRFWIFESESNTSCRFRLGEEIDGSRLNGEVIRLLKEVCF